MVEPLHIPRPDHCISRDLIDEHVLKVLYRLKNLGHEAYVVGGAIRDILRGREPKDFDIATDATPGEIKRIFRNSRIIGRRFRLVHVIFGEHVVEVATLRRAVNEAPVADVEPARNEADRAGHDDDDSDAALEVLDDDDDEVGEFDNGLDCDSGLDCDDGDEVELSTTRRHGHEDLYIEDDNMWGDVESDAFRRDFTINALYYDIKDFSIIDYCGGCQDLDQGIIRSIGDPVMRFMEDPVRMLRAIKFAARFGYTIEPATDAAMREVPDEILKASRFRVIEEVFRILTQKHRDRGLEMLADYGFLAILFPTWSQVVGDEGFEQIRHFFHRVEAEAEEGRFLPLELVAAGLFLPLLGTVDVHSDRYSDVAADLGSAVRQLTIEMDIPKRLSGSVTTLLRGQLYLLFFVTKRRNVQRFVISPEFDWIWRLHDLAFGDVQELHQIQEVWLAAREALPQAIDGWADRPDKRDIFSFRGKTGGGRRGDGEPVSVISDGSPNGDGRRRRRRRRGGRRR